MSRIARSLVCLAVVMFAGACSGGGPRLEADFSARFEQPHTTITSCPVTAIHFRDRSDGEPTAWEWTFDDGSTSSEQNPTWSTGSVVADVTLQVSRGDTQDSITKTISTFAC